MNKDNKIVWIKITKLYEYCEQILKLLEQVYFNENKDITIFVKYTLLKINSITEQSNPQYYYMKAMRG